MINQNNEGRFTVISTKVSPETAEQLDAICETMKVDTYHIFQWFVQALVRMASPHHQLTPDIQRLMAVLESSAGWQNAFNICAPNKELDVAQLVLILQQKDKKGFGAVMIDKPFINQSRQTECVDDILERTVEVCMPGIYRRLRSLAVDMDCTSISDLLITLIDAQMVMNLDKENAEHMQGQNDYHEYLGQIAYGKRTKQTKRRGVDMYDKTPQTTIVFSDEDKAQAKVEAQCGDCLHCDTCNPYGKSYCDVDYKHIEAHDKACDKFEQ